MKTIEELTVKTLEMVAKSDEFQRLCYAIFETMAAAKVMREKVNSYAVPLFQSLNFFESTKWGGTAGIPILDPERAYESDDEALYNEYIDLLHEQHLKHGFKVAHGYCPALIAESNQTRAEILLLQFMQDKIGMPEWKFLEDREKMLELYLSMAAKELK
jgi:hypothetical protein